MTLYRVSYSIDGGNSAGFSWHAKRSEAVAAAKKDYDDDPVEYDNNSTSVAERIETIPIVLTKAGILAILRRYASHPDNG